MRTQMIIRFEPGHEANRVSWLRVDDKSVQKTFFSTLEEASKQVLGTQVIVLVPTADVLLTRVTVPTKNHQRMLKAIPFALEEYLASDVEKLHFAVGSRNEDGTVNVAVVAHETMLQWQEKLRTAGLQPHFLIPDVQAMPATQDMWHILLENEQAFIRSTEQSLMVDSSNADTFLSLMLGDQKEQLPAAITIHDCRQGGFDSWQPNISPTINLIQEPCKEGLFSFIPADGINVRQNINLLQDVYSRREQLGKLWRPWRFAASLAGVWFILQLGMNINETIQLENKSENLRQQTIQIYRSTFPEAKKVVNPKVQMERKLAELRGGGASGAEGLLSLLRSSSGELTATKGLILKSMRYNKAGELNLEVEVPSLQVLDEVKQRLAKQEYIEVEIQSAAAKDNKVQGRLQIKSTRS